MASPKLNRAFQFFVLLMLCAWATTDAQAQFDKLRKKIPGMGGSSELDPILNQIDSARVRFAYARMTLSLADDIIRRQALRNSAKKTTQAQIEKDKKEMEALDRSIVEKRKLVADLGRQTGSGKYEDKTADDVEKQVKAEEQQREEKRAMVDQELADKQAREKDLSAKDRENYAKLAKLLYTAGKQEQQSMETARDVKPRAESAAQNSGNSPGSLLSTKPKRLNEGMKGLNEILTTGPQHLASIQKVAGHLAKIGGVDLTDKKFESRVVTDEDEIPTDW